MSSGADGGRRDKGRRERRRGEGWRTTTRAATREASMVVEQSTRSSALAAASGVTPARRTAAAVSATEEPGSGVGNGRKPAEAKAVVGRKGRRKLQGLCRRADEEREAVEVGAPRLAGKRASIVEASPPARGGVAAVAAVT